MKSELDDLLDEVNGYFDPKSGTSKPSNTSNKPSQSDSYSHNQGQQRTGYPTSIQTSNPSTQTHQSKYNKGFDEILNSPDPFATQTQKQVIKSPGSGQFKDDLLDDLINETSKLSTDYKDTQQRSTFSSRPTQQSTSGLYSAPLGGTSNPTQTAKCFNPYLGPSNKSQGAFAKPCERLRCITCDFVVQRFDGARWDSTSDYYWFRNYIGNVGELKKKLEKDSNCAAYACQCSWKNITDLEEVAKSKELKWVCAGH